MLCALATLTIRANRHQVYTTPELRCGVQTGGRKERRKGWGEGGREAGKADSGSRGKHIPTSRNRRRFCMKYTIVPRIFGTLRHIPKKKEKEKNRDMYVRMIQKRYTFVPWNKNAIRLYYVRMMMIMISFTSFNNILNHPLRESHPLFPSKPGRGHITHIIPLPSGSVISYSNQYQTAVTFLDKSGGTPSYLRMTMTESTSSHDIPNPPSSETPPLLLSKPIPLWTEI